MAKMLGGERGRDAGHGGAARASRALLSTLLLAIMACAPARAGDAVADGLFPGLEVDLSRMERTDTGLYIETLREGSGPVVRPGDRVRVHYEGWLADGTKFDSSRDRGDPLEMPIDVDRVIDGWDQGIVGMRIGELRRLVVPPELGYGEKGAGGVIPPNAMLLFEIELLGATNDRRNLP